MQINFLISTAMAMLSLGSLVQGSPVPCPDSKRDAILRGEISPESCCSYGYCKNDVVVAMDEETLQRNLASGLRYNTK
ncbi:hypothetical protein F5X96DRAFT_631973 [Biscogniauxia mediterranea]|nr:hypothetical protein F5X96DRAFT_631973 [Biscogniauxia mediterranea]